MSDFEDQDLGRLGRRAFLRRSVATAGVLTAGLAAGDLLVSGGAPARAVSPAARKVDPVDLDPVALLRKMIGFDTQNTGDGGVTRPYAEMVKARWDAAGVPAEIIPAPKEGNVHLIARIRGTSGAAPVAVLGHSDVVPVERAKWSVDPFAGVVRDGQIWGRGALDMKGTNAASMSALLKHLHEGARFERDIIVVTDCDEEAGRYGTTWLAEHQWDKLNAGMVLTEGGWFLAQRDKATPMLITATRQDKIPFNVILTADGTATHSSKPNPDSAIVKLSRAIERLDGWLAPVHLNPVSTQYFRALAKATSDKAWAKAIELMLAAPTRQVRERAARLVVARSPYPWLHRALVRTTHAFVIENAGYKSNVIPSTATLTVNCRAVPGGQPLPEFIAQLRERAGRGVTVRLQPIPGKTEEESLALFDQLFKAPPSSIDTPLFTAMSDAAKRTYPQAAFAPALFEAATSLLPWTSRGIPGYGVYPYVLDNDQIVAMHGNDERIGVDALRRGTEFMYGVFDHFRTR